MDKGNFRLRPAGGSITTLKDFGKESGQEMVSAW